MGTKKEEGGVGGGKTPPHPSDVVVCSGVTFIPTQRAVNKVNHCEKRTGQNMGKRANGMGGGGGGKEKEKEGRVGYPVSIFLIFPPVVVTNVPKKNRGVN